MSLVYPVLVFYDNNSFIAQNSCLGDPNAYIDTFISSNKLDKQTIEVYAYDRKLWIALLLESKNKQCDFVIEKDTAKLVKSIEETEDIEIVVDWAKDSELDLFYTQDEITKINRNKQILCKYPFMTKEVLKKMPYKIPVKKRLAKRKVIKQVVQREIKGIKLDIA
jgi:hypothetical protein